MKYKIDRGRLTAKSRHVVLDEETGAGVWVQPGAVTAAYRLQDLWRDMLQRAREEHAAALGKPVGELTAEERDNVDPFVTEEFVQSLSTVLRSCVVRWDEGLVELDGRSAEIDEETSEGVTALDMWIEHMCEHEMPTVWQILGVAGKRARDLEGNSQGPSAGTGGTDEERQAAEAPESTASAAPSIGDQERSARSAGISEVPVVPV
jgi:hypothetical protein